MIKIAGATVNQIPFHWKNNRENILEAISAAQAENVKILCLPELCITGYGCEDVFLSEWLAEKAWEEMLIIASACQNITVSVGLPVRINDIVYNGACVISNRRILGITFKQHLANDGVHYEPRWFKPWPAGKVIELTKGDQTIPVGDVIYEVENLKLGFEICEDGWQKNRPGYKLYERGVNLILNPSASHFAKGKSLLREKDVVLAASKEFNCIYLFVNLLGNEAGRMIYDGDIIFAQDTKLLGVNKRLSFENYKLLICNVDIKNPANSQHLAEIDNKDKNEELTQAVSLALFDYLRKSKAKGFVLSLSGGADSSSCAVMVAEMVKRASKELGWDRFCKTLNLNPNEINGNWKTAVGKILTCAYQGTINSSETTLKAAKELAESIGAEFHSWLIDDEVKAYSQKIESVIGRSLQWKTDDIALQNIQARSRSPIIWMLANVKQAVLLTTSNRSEGDVGYATMDGDTSGSLAPIAGLSKVFIIQWLKWAETNLGHAGLHTVNNLEPTAELRPLENHQTDEDDLMPYKVLLEIEKLAILERKAPEQVWHSMKANYSDHSKLKNHIRKFFRLWTINQWKRERIAPSFHLDELNVDPRTWCRFPILSSGFEEELAKLDSLT
jgi:NAD+ synthase (glutamine-hydrolysing)